MNTDIRGYIINNFKDGNKDEIKQGIEKAISNKDEITLPGLGVFFEILWNASDDDCKEKMLGMLSSGRNISQISDAKKNDISNRAIKEVNKTLNQEPEGIIEQENEKEETPKQEEISNTMTR